MSKYLALLLDSPQMSWGASSPTYKVRGTAAEPTPTAMQGLVACCMGLSNKLDPTKYEELGYSMSMSKVEVLKGRPVLLVDDQIAAGTGGDREYSAAVVDTDGKLLKAGKMFCKHYLTGVAFGVVLEITSDVLAAEIGAKMSDPAWPPFLGRKACVPSEPVYHGMFDTPEMALDKLTGYYQG